MLKRKAEQGVKIYVVVYKEVTQTMSMSSHHTKVCEFHSDRMTILIRLCNRVLWRPSTLTSLACVIQTTLAVKILSNSGVTMRFVPSFSK